MTQKPKKFQKYGNFEILGFSETHKMESVNQKMLKKHIYPIYILIKRFSTSKRGLTLPNFEILALQNDQNWTFRLSKGLWAQKSTKIVN